MVLIGEIVTGSEDDLNPEPTFGVSGEVHGGWRFFRCEGIAQVHEFDRELRGRRMDDQLNRCTTQHPRRMPRDIGEGFDTGQREHTLFIFRKASILRMVIDQLSNPADRLQADRQFYVQGISRWPGVFDQALDHDHGQVVLQGIVFGQ